MNDDLQSFIEPELEARLVALILGEASAFEVEELERILQKRPEVALAKRQLEEAHELVGLAMTPPDDDEDWKLSSERREKVLAVIGEEASTKEEVIKERRISISQWRSIYATAACLMVAVVVLALVAPMSERKDDLAELVSFSAKEPFTEDDLMAQRDLVQERRKELTTLIQEYGIPYFDGREANPVGQAEEQMYRRAQVKLDDLEQDRRVLQAQLRKLEDAPNQDLVRTAAGLDLPENQVTDHFAKFRAENEKAESLMARNLGENHPEVIAAKSKADGALKEANEEVASLKEVLETRLSLVDKQVDKVSEMVREKKDGTVDLAMQQHQYTTAKEEYEQARLMLREMEVAQAESKSKLAKAELKFSGGADLGTTTNVTYDDEPGAVDNFFDSGNEVGSRLRFQRKDSLAASDKRKEEAKKYLAAIDAGLGNPAVNEPASAPDSATNEFVTATRNSKDAGRSRFGRRYEGETDKKNGAIASNGNRAVDAKEAAAVVGKPIAGAEMEEFGELPATGKLFDSRTATREKSKSETKKWFAQRGESKSENFFGNEPAPAADPLELASAPSTRPEAPAPAKPAAPKSSMASVVAAETASPAEIPVPELAEVEPSADFGDGNRFGKGWGAGGAGGGAEKDRGGVAANGAAPANGPEAKSKPVGYETLSEEPADTTLSFTLEREAGQKKRQLATGTSRGLSASGLAALEDRSVDEMELLEEEEVAGEDVRTTRSYAYWIKGMDRNGAIPDITTESLSGAITRFDVDVEKGGQEKQDRLSGLSLADKDMDGFDGVTEMEGFAGTGEPVVGNPNVDFISPGQGATIPGIPAAQNQEVSGIVTGGVRSGAAAVNRNSIDGILNSPEKAPEGEIVASSNLVGQELVRRQEAVRSSDELLVEGRKLYSEGDYAGAVEKYRESLDNLPYGSATEERRKVFRQHLQDGSVALSQQHRRVGKYHEARDLLEEVKESDPGFDMAQKGLEYLDDPIRTNPSLTYENTKDVDKIRRNLYKGEGYYNLGLYDKAEEEFKEVLRTDPYNKAARRWMERSSAIKSDYYRAEYDHTRARMLMEVDAAWETAVPPVEEKQKALADAKSGEGDEKDGLLPTVEGLDSEDIVARRFKVPLNFESLLRGDDRSRGEGDPFASDDGGGGSSIKARKPIVEVLREQGIAFPEGTSASLLPGSGTLIVRNTPENLALIDMIKKAVDKANEEAGVVTDVYKDFGAKYLVDDETDGKIRAIPLYPKVGASEEDSVKTASKLENIILPELALENTTVEEAIVILEQGALANDPDGEGLDLDVYKPRGVEVGGSESLDEPGELFDPGKVKIDKLQLANVPLSVAAQYVAEKAKLRYRIDDGKVTFLPLMADAPGDLLSRRWKVPSSFVEFIEVGSVGGEEDPFATDQPETNPVEVEVTRTMKEHLELQGLVFSEGSSASFIPESGTLIVRNTPTQLELVDAIVTASIWNHGDEDAAKEARKKELEKIQNFETSTAEKTDSTFSLNVSDVSFKLAKSDLAQGKWPDPAKVRPEEFFNALDYDDRKPSQSEKVACEIEQGAHPFMQQRNLMRVSMSTASLGRNASTPLRLTVLLDQSGSMERADRAESVLRAFDLLTDQLNAGDEITLVGFARTPRLLAERVKGNESKKLLQIVSKTLTEGGTNLEEALGSGIQLAKQQFVEGAQNRIILLTDGAANLGDALPENLAKQVEEMRKAGIAFDACGVGADGLNDEILTSLTKQGDGRYYFLDRPEDADEGFAKQIAGALRPAAKNVKVQVIFNPQRVSKFKLYGFEKHLLKKEDFRNDSVDAAEMAAEESGVALYHFDAMPEGQGEIGHVSVRFLDTATNQMVERKWPIPYEENAPNFFEADPALRLAGAAGLFAEKLKGSAVGERVQLKELRKEVDALQGVYQDQVRYQELRTMLQQAGD